MKRRLPLVLVVVAAGALLAYLLGAFDSPSAARLDAGRPAGQGPGPGLLQAEGLEEDADEAGAPGLRGARQEEPGGAARGDVTVRVEGPAGDPVPGAWITLHDEAGQVGPALATDARGAVRYRDLPYDGSHHVEFWEKEPTQERGRSRWDELEARYVDDGESRTVTGPTITYQAATGLWMHVQVVDAETSMHVTGARARCPRARFDNESFVDTPARFFITPRVGHDWWHGVKVEAPEGWVAWDRASVAETVSPYVEKLTFRYPLRREARIAVRAVDEEGRPVAAVVDRVRFAGDLLRGVAAVGDAHGRLSVRGVPWLRDESVRMRVVRDDRRGWAWTGGVLPSHPGEVLDVEVRLPATDDPIPTMPSEGIGIGGGGRGAIYYPRSGRKNEVIVTVLRRDGTPAIGCKVTVDRRHDRTDARGVARLAGVRPGPHVVSARQPGLLPIKGSLDVGAEGVFRLTLRESEGATVEVSVVDGDGRPLPYARLDVRTLSTLPWLDVEGVTQRLDPYTDHLGRRVLRHVEAGKVRVEAQWGARKRAVTIEAGDGETGEARIVLPAGR